LGAILGVEDLPQRSADEATLVAAAVLVHVSDE
jgi:hypothetical protein